MLDKIKIIVLKILGYDKVIKEVVEALEALAGLTATKIDDKAVQYLKKAIDLLYKFVKK